MFTVRTIFLVIAPCLLMGCATDFNKSKFADQHYPRGEWIDLETRSFQSVRYDQDDHTLRLLFNTGTLHAYENFPEAEFNRFMLSGGKWGYYKTHIRDSYSVIAKYPAQNPGSFSAIHRSMWTEPVRVYHSNSSKEASSE